MLKKVLKVLVFLLVFVGGMFGFAYLYNKDNADLTVQMADASFPVLSVEIDGTAMNRMPGYAGEIKAQNLKTDITPVPKNGSFTLVADTFGNEIKTIYYEVLTADGAEFIKNTKAEDLSQKDDKVTADISIGSLSGDTEEYILSVTVQTGDKRFIHYYTRLKDGTDLHGKECVDFARDFSSATFDKDKAEDLKKYLETNETSSDSSIHKADIHSGLDHISWGTLEPEIVRRPSTSIQEINASSASVLLDYEITAKGDTDIKEYYHVKEFFRVRYTKSRTFLISYERTVDQMFDESSMVISNKGITVGVADSDLSYMCSDDGNTVCFVQDNALWSYHRSAGSIALVFSFYGDNREDMRNTFDGHSIELIQVDDDGGAWFTVNGYMNRGSHEGQVGSALYHYSSETNSVEEKTFLQSSLDYKVLMENMKTPGYAKDEDTAYIFFGSAMCRLNFEDGSIRAVADGLLEGSYAISEDGSLFAWQKEGGPDDCTALQVEDFAQGISNEIRADAGEYLKPLGFMGADLVYGTAKEEDVTAKSTGGSTFRMYKLTIRDNTGRTVKEYAEDGVYVTGAEMADGTITLTRVKKKANGKGYTAISSDSLMNTGEQEEASVKLQSFTTDRKGSQMRLAFTWPIQDTEPKVLKPRLVLPEKPREPILDETQATPRYYVYGLGKLQESYTSPAKAIKRADELMGVVTTADSDYIWERSGRPDEADNSAGLPSMEELDSIFAGESDGCRVLDLKGCTLDQVLYLCGRGYPVLGYRDGKKVLITGYDYWNIDVMNRKTGEVKKAGMNDSTKAFKDSGNRFVSYIEK